MNKVIGIGKFFFIGLAFTFLTSNTTAAQDLSQSEQLYLKNLSDSILTNQGNFEKIDSFLWEIGNYSNSFTDKVKKEEIRAFYWAEYAMNSPQYSNKLYDTASRNQLIRLSEACIGTYKIYYTKGVWKEYRFDILLLRGLVYLYSWNQNHELSLSALKEYEDEVLKKEIKTKWELFDIYSVYSDFYNSMGLYEKEAEMNQLIKDGYEKNGCETVYDSLKLLSAIRGLITYSVRKNDLDRVFELVDEYERYFFRINYFLKPKNDYAEVLEQLALLSLNYSIKYARECIDDEVAYLEKEHLDSLSCPSCLSGLKSIQLEYYKRLEDWKNIYQIISTDPDLKNSHYGLYLEACLNLGRKEDCLRIIDFAMKDLSSEFNGLDKFHPTLRAKKIQQITLSRNYKNIRQVLYSFPSDSDFVAKYFDFLVKFKAIEVGLNSRYETTLKLIKSESLARDIHNSLKPHESLLEFSRISRTETIRAFDRISNGISFRLIGKNDSRPLIREISPHTLAFESGLKINDVIVSINGVDTKGKSTEDILKMFNSVSGGAKNKVGITRKGIDKVQYYYTRRDSIFIYHDTIISKYVSYSLKGNDDKNYKYVLLDAKNIDGLYNDQYISQKSTSLSKELIPILKQLATSKSIYFSTDGVFNKINIETLTITDSVGTTHYLGDLFDIHVVSSARDLLSKDNTTYTNNSITLFGYPNYTLSQSEQAKLVSQTGIDTNSLSYSRGGDAITDNFIFKPLVATKHEVEDIGQLLQKNGWQVQVYTGVNALEEQIKKILSPRVLHIATHGFFAEDLQSERQASFMGMNSKKVMENPLLRSGLAFAGAERSRTDTTHELLSGIDDGILTAEEAQYLYLDSTELVVLSACETGLGSIINGEGVYGLQRAFLAAGAKSILMSLWKVDDIATEALMKGFYKHWLDDGMSKHDALWQAKLDLRNDKVHPEWAKPYYWGAFVLIGE